jgi:hypothetical protein
MDIFKVHRNQHDLFINALLSSSYTIDTMVQKVRDYTRALDGRERLAFARAVNQYLMDAEFFNKQDDIHILRQLSRVVPHFN